ncbi:MAG: hypothetical protein CVU08_05355 [Bacteroidetes bacterium HGW-Bacteroidetes-3]|nr:MAG: hypothetical protein CVU08_05355 [Bacteroidetes bacterium HGW-Bacteroidetes-3]
MGVSAEKAVGLSASIRHCEGYANLLNILLHKLATPGFSLQSLTQFHLIIKILLALFAVFLCAICG